AGCSAGLRASRHTAVATAATSAAISAGCSPNATFATTKIATGMVDATMPGTPPICSSRVGSSRSCDPPAAPGSVSDSGRGPGFGPSVTVLLWLSDRRLVGAHVLHRRTGAAEGTGRCAPEPSRCAGGADLVERVVEDLAPVPQRQPPPHAHGATGLDAGDAPPAEPDEGDVVGAVEQLGLQRRVRVVGSELHAAQPAEHRHLLAAGAVGRALRSRLLRTGLEIVGIQLVHVAGQPAQHAAERTAIGAGHLSPSSLGLALGRNRLSVTRRKRPPQPSEAPFRRRSCERTTGGDVRRAGLAGIRHGWPVRPVLQPFAARVSAERTPHERHPSGCAFAYRRRWVECTPGWWSRADRPGAPQRRWRRRGRLGSSSESSACSRTVEVAGSPACLPPPSRRSPRSANASAQPAASC